MMLFSPKPQTIFNTRHHAMKDFYFFCHDTTGNEKRATSDDKKSEILQSVGTRKILSRSTERKARIAGNVVRNLPIDRVVCSTVPEAILSALAANMGCSNFMLDDRLNEVIPANEKGKTKKLAASSGDGRNLCITEGLRQAVAGALELLTEDGTLLVSQVTVLITIASLLDAKLTEDHLSDGCILQFKNDTGGWTIARHETRVILISGATQGIGHAIADRLLTFGYRLSLGARSVEALSVLFGEADETLQFSEFDAEKPESMEAWVRSAVREFGRIDGLVNNAGNSDQVNLADGVDYKKLRMQFEINCEAPLRMTELCLPHLKASGAGRIINMNSMSGQRVLNPFVGYNMTKHGLTGLTKTTQHVGWEDGIRAMDICPGFVATRMSVWTDKIRPEDMIQPRDIAELVRQAIERPNRAYVPKNEVLCMKEAAR